MAMCRALECNRLISSVDSLSAKLNVRTKLLGMVAEMEATREFEGCLLTDALS
jgi:hypothetical protein